MEKAQTNQPPNQPRIGTRIISPSEVGRYKAEFYQISVYAGLRDPLGRLADIASACRKAGASWVAHPVMFSLLSPSERMDLFRMAEHAGEAMILHDERSPGGGRLSEENSSVLSTVISELSSLARLSFENALNTADALWFWKRFGRSVTLDIGHMESAGLDSTAYISALPEEIIQRVDYVHIHRNGELRGGLTDHWPLETGCRELDALRVLLGRKRTISVILEINEREETDRSLGLIRDAAGL
jgi:sugar phosphate isomerase/epimerase